MPTFDVVCKLDHHEVDNAVQQTQKEITTRYDFRDSGSSCERTEAGVVLKSNSEGRIAGARDVFNTKVAKRGIPMSSLDAQKAELAGGQTWKQLIKLKEGIEQKDAKIIVKAIKDSKIKVQVSIQGDEVRVSGKKRDHLQEVIALLKGQDFGMPLQFVNFRD